MLVELNYLQKKTDREFQLRRRLECANEDGVVKCISCGVYGHYKSFDGGHFIQKTHKGTRYATLNVWPQCKKCNKYLYGNHAKYRDKLVEKLGQSGVIKLEELKDKMPFEIGTSWREWCIEVFIFSKNVVKQLQKNVRG